jgi:hypothetical protein
MRSKGAGQEDLLFEATGTARKAGRIGKPKRPESRNNTEYRATRTTGMNNLWNDRNKLYSRCYLCQ